MYDDTLYLHQTSQYTNGVH